MRVFIDRLKLSWSLSLSLDHPTSRPATRVTTSLSWTETNWHLHWLYLNFHRSDWYQNFREDPSNVPDPIPITMKMPNPSQEPQASFKSPNEDLKDIDVLCTFKIKIESQHSDCGCTKDQWQYQNQYQNAKAQNQDSKDMYAIFTFKIKIESPNSKQDSTKD